MHFTVTYNFFVFGDPERAFITPFLQLFYLNRISIHCFYLKVKYNDQKWVKSYFLQQYYNIIL